MKQEMTGMKNLHHVNIRNILIIQLHNFVTRLLLSNVNRFAAAVPKVNLVPEIKLLLTPFLL